jgi:hypothetical protein
MVREVARVLGISPEPPEVYLPQLQDVIRWKETGHSNQYAAIKMPTSSPATIDTIRTAANLGQAATQLLKAAAADPNATIIRSRNYTGMSIAASGTNFVETGNPRSEAEWEAALKQLEERRLVVARGHKREIFSVTQEGFSIADSIAVVPE